MSSQAASRTEAASSDSLHVVAAPWPASSLIVLARRTRDAQPGGRGRNGVALHVDQVGALRQRIAVLRRGDEAITGRQDHPRVAHSIRGDGSEPTSVAIARPFTSCWRTAPISCTIPAASAPGRNAPAVPRLRITLGRCAMAAQVVAVAARTLPTPVTIVGTRWANASAS